MTRLVSFFLQFAVALSCGEDPSSASSGPAPPVATVQTDATVYFPEDTVYVTLRNESGQPLLFSWMCTWSIHALRMDNEWEHLYRPDCSRVRVRPERLEPGHRSTKAVWVVPWDISELSWYRGFRIEVRVQNSEIPSTAILSEPFTLRRY